MYNNGITTVAQNVIIQACFSQPVHYNEKSGNPKCPQSEINVVIQSISMQPKEVTTLY